MKGHHKPLISSLDHNGVIYSDNLSKAEIFNSYFLANSRIDSSNYSPSNLTSSGITLTRLEIDESDVLDILKCLDVSKATGPDGLSAKILKEAAPCIASPLSKLINMSLSKQVFPSEWKKANVTPIHKSGSTSECGNYRPISLLSCVSKVMERVVFKCLFNFCRDNLVITDKQSGFTPNDGAINQWVYLYHQFSKAIDEQKEIRVVFGDITKAFDKVYHPALLQKLANVGIAEEALAWVENYLSNRIQRVVINGESSSWGHVEAGVPQGSVLGPLLFLIYINDIVDIVHTNIRLFADDTVFYVTVEDPQIASNELNEDMQAVSEWSREWLLTFNPKKTKEMIISKKRRNAIHPNLTYEGTIIENVKEHKHLGLLLKSDLSWTPHINSTCTKAMKMVCVLRSLQHRLNRRSLKTLYFSFIRPVLEYGNIVFSNCTQANDSDLEKVQLAAARAVIGARRFTSHSKIYDETGWETLAARRNKQKLVLMFKIVNKFAPDYLHDLLPATVQNRTRYNFRSHSKFTIFRTRTDLFGNSFFPSVVKMWNSLPIETRKSESLQEFKSKLNKNRPKKNDLYYVGNRKENILLAQLRTGCSSLKADLFKIGVVTTPVCDCGTGNEDTYHYFCECPRYLVHRNALQCVVLPHTSFTIYNLLYGAQISQKTVKLEIYEAVLKYIKDTLRFC